MAIDLLETAAAEPGQPNLKPQATPDPVDEASEESFPASDPPPWSPLQARPPAAPAAPFSADELRDIHAQDVGAATRIAGLLIGIFTTGLLIYLSIAFWVASSGWGQ